MPVHAARQRQQQHDDERRIGELHWSYAVLTINTGLHPLMRRMHVSDLPLPVGPHDKRRVVPIEIPAVDQRVAGTIKEASGLWLLVPVSVFDAGPVNLASLDTVTRTTFVRIQATMGGKLAVVMFRLPPHFQCTAGITRGIAASA